MKETSGVSKWKSLGVRPRGVRARVEPLRVLGSSGALRVKTQRELVQDFCSKGLNSTRTHASPTHPQSETPSDGSPK